MFGITILGNNSAVPAFGRHPTSQVITTSGGKFLVDCGEGTQIQMINYKIRRSRISHIFISHLHGDHYFGLIGLLNSFALLNRTQKLTIVGPEILKTIIDLQFKVADTVLPYKLEFLPVNSGGYITTVDNIEISSFPTDHRIECYGFVFKEKKNLRKIDVQKTTLHKVPYSFYHHLQNGADYKSENGRIIPNEELTTSTGHSKKYAFCADGRYNETILKNIEGADMIYHETTYLDNMADRAFMRFHSTTRQAGRIAKKASVKKLLIGHFSSKYDSLDEFLSETQEVFPQTELALEGVTYMI